MKVDERHASDLAGRVPGVRVFLLHGDDVVLVADRARALVEAFARRGDALFSPVELHGADHGRVVEHLNSPMLGGGFRLVRLRGATDAAAASVQAALDTPTDGALVVEAGSLAARSKLRGLVERSNQGAAIVCRSATPRETAAGIDRIMADYGLQIDTAARELLVRRVAEHRATLPDAEKLALLVAGSKRAIGIVEIMELDQDGGASLDALVAAAALGRADEADRVAEALLDDGAAPVALIRALLGHLARLREVRTALDGGAALDVAMAALQPPVFFRRVAEFQQAVKAWSSDKLDAGGAALWVADRACRTTGAPAAALCRAAVRDVARAASARH